jgi:hypothetical protein
VADVELENEDTIPEAIYPSGLIVPGLMNS